MCLDATLEELASVGYGVLRIKDVASRTGVNKTTIYRRWPRKQELVAVALRSVTAERVVPPNTDSLRGELLETGRHMALVMGSAQGQALRRILIAEERNPEFIDGCLAAARHQGREGPGRVRARLRRYVDLHNPRGSAPAGRARRGGAVPG